MKGLQGVAPLQTPLGGGVVKAGGCCGGEPPMLASHGEVARS